MDRREIYRLTGPTVWAKPPVHFSHSSLRVIEECPLRWQLSRSQYGDLPAFPERPRPTAIVGKIVHGFLDRLIRELSLRGLPAPGSGPFREVMAALNVMEEIRAALEECQRELAAHPRSLGLAIHQSGRDIYNQICRLFQPMYKRLVAAYGLEGGREAIASGHQPAGLLEKLRLRGTLTEVRVVHPELPLVGVIDLVWDDGGSTRLVDYKGGDEKPEHLEQIQLYGLLWFRHTGNVPASVELCYPTVTRTFSVRREDVIALEEAIALRLERLRGALEVAPAEARTGVHCGYCDVRQFCGSHWDSRRAAGAEDGWQDLTVRVVEDRLDGVVRVAQADGREFVVRPDADVRDLYGPFDAGEVIRILGASVAVDSDELRLARRVEIFRGT